MTAINAGIGAGIFGFDGIMGILFYVAIFFVGSLFVALKVKFNAKKYFIDGASVYFEGMGANLLVRYFIWGGWYYQLNTYAFCFLKRFALNYVFNFFGS